MPHADCKPWYCMRNGIIFATYQVQPRLNVQRTSVHQYYTQQKPSRTCQQSNEAQMQTVEDRKRLMVRTRHWDPWLGYSVTCHMSRNQCVCRGRKMATVLSEEVHNSLTYDWYMTCQIPYSSDYSFSVFIWGSLPNVRVWESCGKEDSGKKKKTL